MDDIKCDCCGKLTHFTMVVVDDDMCKIWCEHCAPIMNPYRYGD